MRVTSAAFLVLTLLFLTTSILHADDYLTKDGKLTQQLKITQLQGGFAGFTGFEYTIEPDGAWTSASLFNKKATPKNKGKLTAKELETLAALLAKHELAKLPEKSGKQPGANPHTLTIEYGKTKAHLVGQMEPKIDASNPASVDSRFAGVYQGINELLKNAKKDAEK
jgi:hypothetical protein